MKFISPNPLSAFYPYPAITEHGQLPIIFRLAPYVFLVLMIITAWFITRRGQMGRVWVFGILFYVVMLLMVIQFISVGKAIIADRYTYIPYIGLTFIIGMWLDYLLSKKQAFRIGGIVLAGILFLFSLFFIYTTVERTRVWKNDITLWTDALGKYPDVRMNFIYERRGNTFLQNKQYDLALNDYMTILKNDSLDENAYASVGSIYGRFLNQPDKALPYLERGYKINPKNPFILKSLGVVHGMQGQIPKALEYFLQAYKLDPDDPILLQNIAGSYINIGEKLKSEEFKAKAEALGKKKVNSEQ
jgi:tetratricopeptide (TPR) repeat protein